MINTVKKVVIYSMVGMIQIGLGTSAIEATPLHNAPGPAQQQDNRHNQDGNRDQGRHEQERHERERIEQERHEREMKRRHHESDRDWHERQRHERERHDNAMNEILAGIIGIIIGSSID